MHNIQLKNMGDSKIPEKVKSEAVTKYKHEEVKTAVINITKGKCVFCESPIETVDYTNIEHFYPKSIYYKYTFLWSNLFPACRKCNIPKGDVDTKLIPLLHPVLDNAEVSFSYQDLKIVVNEGSPQKTKAENTIKFCNLDRISLCRAHSNILLVFYEVEEKIQETIDHYNKLTQDAAKLKIALKLLESIDNLKDKSGNSMSYAGFMRYIIRESKVIQNSIVIINANMIELGMEKDYDFNWNV